MNQETIRQTCDQLLATWAASNGLAVHYEGEPFDYTGAPYVKTNLLPAEPDNPSLGGTHIRYMGIYQVTVICDESLGANQTDSLAASLCLVYPRGLMVSGLQVNNTPSIAPAFNADGLRHVVVRVVYMAESFS